MIELVQQGPVARVHLNRPEARNALAMRDWEALADAVEESVAAGARVLVVEGTGGSFCAGADLSEFETFQADEAERVRFRAAMRRGLDSPATAPIATIAWIDGPCFGAGVALAMACDLRIAAPAARFAITPAKMGIGYPQEDVARLVALVGRGWAGRLLYTGSAIDAATAERIGLVEQVADDAAVEALVAEIFACDGGSIAMLKRGIATASAGVAVDAEQDRRFDELLGSNQLREALSRRRAGRGLPPAGR